MKRLDSMLEKRGGRRTIERMESMSITLISLVKQDRNIRARLRAHAPEVGVVIWLEVRFDAPEHSGRRRWAAEAYDRALAVLDPA